jgi:hypothetical protein
VELGYTHQDTRITLGLFNGDQNLQYTGLDNTKITGTGAAATSSPAATASDSNNAKDLQFIINQFIGDDGVAVNYFLYNGFNGSIAPNGTAYTLSGAGSGGTGDSTGQEYFATSLFLSSPIVKNWDVKAGGALEQTGTGLFAQPGAVASDLMGGFFGELDFEADEITPVGFRVDYTTDTQKSYTDTVKFTLGALTPFVHNIYMNPQVTLSMADAGSIGYNDTYKLTDSLNLFF